MKKQLTGLALLAPLVLGIISAHAEVPTAELKVKSARRQELLGG